MPTKIIVIWNNCKITKNSAGITNTSSQQLNAIQIAIT
jgi:hypothetical protein